MQKYNPKIQLHMHQLREFIDNRYEFYNSYFMNKKPRWTTYKGMDTSLLIGSAVDFAIKQYYMNKYILKREDIEHNIFSSNEFKLLPTRLDQVKVLALVRGYINKYNNDEYFHDYIFDSFNINYNNQFSIYISPDILSFTYSTLGNDLVIIEIKTSYNEESTTETLDFQTMCYAWGCAYHFDKLPIGVIKRNILKPQIKQKKDETNSEFEKRLTIDPIEKEDRYYKSDFREVNFDMVINFEKYLDTILSELYEYIMLVNNNHSNNNGDSKYKFYKKSTDYWGL